MRDVSARMILEYLRNKLLTLGIPGIFLIAFLAGC
jgi:hypothetical protein